MQTRDEQERLTGFVTAQRPEPAQTTSAAAQPRGRAKALAGLQVLSDDGERVLYRGWRSEGNASARLAVLPAAEHPAPASLERLTHEYGLRDELDSDWAVRPLDLVRE